MSAMELLHFLVVVVSFLSNRIQHMKQLTETHGKYHYYIKALLHSAGGHQRSCEAHQAGNQTFAIKPT